LAMMYTFQVECIEGDFGEGCVAMCQVSPRLGKLQLTKYKCLVVMTQVPHEAPVLRLDSGQTSPKHDVAQWRDERS